MTAIKLIREPLWATLLAALVATMVSLFVFVPNSEAAPVADGKYYPYIIGGEPVPNGKYPFMATLIDPNDPLPGTKPQDELRCGGSLIDNTHVLTAGHCVFKGGKVGFYPGVHKYQVYVGRTVLTSDQGQVRNIKDIDVHPKYPGGTKPFDVAVLTLSHPVSGIKPIELATSKQNYLETPGRDATVAGWGQTNKRVPCVKDPPPNIPNRMREAQLPIVSDSRADKVLQKVAPTCPKGTPFPDEYFSRLHIAAGGGTKEEFCQGDSGGPLFVRTSGNDDDGRKNGDNNGDDDNGARYTQIGIVSWNIGCAAGYLGVYTEVNAEPIASFIERTAENGNGDDDNGDDNNGDDK